MICEQTGRALSLISGIEVCKQNDADFWRSMVVRIVMDLDEVAAARDLARIADVLADMWGKLPDKERPTAPSSGPSPAPRTR